LNEKVSADAEEIIRRKIEIKIICFLILIILRITFIRYFLGALFGLKPSRIIHLIAFYLAPRRVAFIHPHGSAVL